MNFETQLIKTKNWRRTWYGVISLILFAIALIVVFVFGPQEGLLDKDYLLEWFGPFKKPILWLNVLFYINGVVFMFLEYRRNYKTIGKVLMTDESINITESTETKVFPVSGIDAIRLKYYGYKSFWRKGGAGNMKGNMNYITIIDPQNREYAFEFFLSSYADKRNLIGQLLSFRKQGIKIKLDYLYHEVYPNDIDFSELKFQEYWHK
jgi:hypothetical protein